MRRALSFAFFLACSFAFAAGSEESSAQAQQAPMRRFALVMGANSGGEGSVRLRYAVSDARAFASLLTELGGVKGEDLVLLSDPSLSAFRGAAERMRAATVAANASGQRCELMLYYSGHSDEEGLLLGRERLGYSDLRAAIERVPAAVRVAILDSCSSGSLTRAKGGASRPAFLFDASAEMEGHAYITSSSEAEAAQESDRIGGSFFTHYLVSALRGAADIHGEGKVTLNEAYAYAFRETLASTENTQYGPQHPAYEISLTGSGDLVFTDLRSSRAGLALAEALSGSIYVRDAKGNLAVELDKAAGDSMEIGLPPGKYAVSMIDGASRSQADIVVPAGGRTFLAPADFRPAVPEKAAARGSAANAGAVDTLATSVAGFPIVFSARPFPDLSQGGFSSDEDKPISFNALWGQARDVKVQVSSLVNADSGDLQGFQYASLMNAVKGRASGVQFAPIANVAYGGFGGTQIFSLVNYSGGGGGGQRPATRRDRELRDGKGRRSPAGRNRQRRVRRLQRSAAFGPRQLFKGPRPRRPGRPDKHSLERLGRAGRAGEYFRSDRRRAPRPREHREGRRALAPALDGRRLFHACRLRLRDAAFLYPGLGGIRPRLRERKPLYRPRHGRPACHRPLHRRPRP
jgi:hypothetical protein